MNPEIFRFLHLFGIFLLFAAVGGVIVRKLVAADAGAAAAKDRAGSLAGLTHGLALIVVLISGFGMLGTLHFGFPAWAWGKLAIWLIFGGILVVIRRSATAARWLWWLLPLLGITAAWLALTKPGG
jgi:hypothetical protein